MPDINRTDDLEREAAQRPTGDFQHQPDQSRHLEEIVKSKGKGPKQQPKQS